MALIAAFRAADPDRFKWRDPPYEYEADKMPIDILAGSSELREQIEGGVPTREIAKSWEPSVGAFMRVRERYLLSPATSDAPRLMPAAQRIAPLRSARHANRPGRRATRRARR